jgi:N-acetylmuramoyl-L-alanine amidase
MRVFFSYNTTIPFPLFSAHPASLMKNILYFIIFLVFQGVFHGPAAAGETVSIAVSDTRETITLNVPDANPNKVFIVNNPERLVVDVPSMKEASAIALPSGYKGKLVKEIRFGQFSPDTSRFVFDLTLPSRVVGSSVGNGSKRLSVIIAPESANEESKEDVRKVPEKQPAPQKPEPAKPMAEKSVEQPKPVKESKPAPVAKTSNKKPMIVIDAGHGGDDPGAIGSGGTKEKAVVLQYAKELKAKLLKSGKYNVKLTREDDRFIMLRKRIEIARKAGATIFISLHADSAPEPNARGLSVYTVSEKASDEESAALAASENKVDIIAGMDLSDEREDVADILISLAQRDTKNQSSQLADLIIQSLNDKVKLLSNSHRFAGFAVLKAPDVPSVLVELGFLTTQEKELQSSTYREKVVSGIAEGIETYLAQCRKAED